MVQRTSERRDHQESHDTADLTLLHVNKTKGKHCSYSVAFLELGFPYSLLILNPQLVLRLPQNLMSSKADGLS